MLSVCTYHPHISLYKMCNKNIDFLSLLVLLDFSENSPHEYRDNAVAAAEFITAVPTILYNMFLPHSAPISMNLYSNALIRSVLQDNKNNTFITSINQPLSVSKVCTLMFLIFLKEGFLIITYP